jgi:hypothetical protein
MAISDTNDARIVDTLTLEELEQLFRADLANGIGDKRPY